MYLDREECRDGTLQGPSFNGHGLGEVPGLVDVAAADDGDVVGQELEGHDVEDRRQPGVDGGQELCCKCLKSIEASLEFS